MSLIYSHSLTPQQEKDLREATTTFAETKIGQECILDLVQFAKEWIYDNAAPPKAAAPKPSAPAKTVAPTPAPAPVATPTPVSTILTLPPAPVSSKPCTPTAAAPTAASKKPAPAPQKVKAAPKGKNTPQAPKVLPLLSYLCFGSFLMKQSIGTRVQKDLDLVLHHCT